MPSELSKGGAIVKIKKTVTEAVAAANRANSRHSTGPVTDGGKASVGQNAVRHGLLSSKIVFETQTQKEEYDHLLELWITEFKPKGFLQNHLVEKIARTTWKLGMIETLETKALLNRQQSVDDVTGIFSAEIDLPIDAGDLPLNRSWDCEKLVVRASSGNDHARSNGSRHPFLVNGQPQNGTQSSGHNQDSERGQLEIEAILGDSLELFTRYRARLEKDFSKAVEMLRSLQREAVG